MVGHFTLPVSSWFADYYDPMQKRIDELGSKYKDNAALSWRVPRWSFGDPVFPLIEKNT